MQTVSCRCIKVQGGEKTSNRLCICNYAKSSSYHLAIHDDIKREDFQRDFLKFTAKHILNLLSVNDFALHKLLKVDAVDRSYRVWKGIA
jgi:hypothetical protein